MDVYFSLSGLQFVWNAEKAQENKRKHNIAFETAAEAFSDVFAIFKDASTPDEARLAIVGQTFAEDLLVVVHLEYTEQFIRVISARRAEPKEARDYENDEAAV